MVRLAAVRWASKAYIFGILVALPVGAMRIPAMK